MAEEKPKAVTCPNCQGPAIRAGNEITCEACDATYTITKKDGAKVRKLGPIQDHEERLKKIEASIFAEKPETPEQQGGEDDDDEPVPGNGDESQEILDGDILPR